jgi:hypothetical protein
MSIKKEWELFKEAVINKQAGPGQILDMKRAFYGGCAVTFTTVIECSSDEYSVNEGSDKLDKIYTELEAFSAENKAMTAAARGEK